MRGFLPLDYAIRNLGRRVQRTILSLLASALVAGIVVVTTGFVRGLHSAFASASRDDMVVVLSAVSEKDVLRSAISPAVPGLISADVAGLQTIAGHLAVSPEIHLGTNVQVSGQQGRESQDYQGFVRGVLEEALLVHDGVTILRGHWPDSGEVLVGRLVAGKFGVDDQSMEPGQTLRFEGTEFRISGVFAAPGTTMESEIWTHLHELKGIVKRDDISAVFLRMNSPKDAARVEVFCRRRLDLELISLRADDYYSDLAAYFEPIRLLAWIMAAMIGVASLFSGANSLNAAVQDRVKELATLTTCGFSTFALGVALVAESLVIASAGGLLGCGAAQLLAHKAAVRIAMGAFEIRPDAVALLSGLGVALVVGICGALPALWTLARKEPAQALKDA